VFVIVEGFYDIKFYLLSWFLQKSRWVRVGLFMLKFQPALFCEKPCQNPLFDDHVNFWGKETL